MDTDEQTGFWPASLAHLARPYCEAGSEYIKIAEISEAPVAEFVGSKTVSVALVPYDQIEQLLGSIADTGYQVQAHGPLPIVDDEGSPHKSGFWIEGISRDTRFEPVVNAWHGSDKDVIVPDNNLLMVFGLIPRHTGETEISWDDPHAPVYDVVRASTVSDYALPKEERQHAYVEIRRDYLLEYCRIKQCAAVAFYYEQRWSDGDPEFDRAIADRDNVDIDLPGRKVNLQTHRHDTVGRQYSQVWGRQIVLQRGERRIIEVDDPDLEWPDHPGTMSLERAGHKHLMAYVNDKVLQQYEGRDEFDIHPVSGSVSYRGQWSVSYCRRIGRNHIAIELKKLYEGTRAPVIEHWHGFAVSKAEAEADSATSKDANIGNRAQDLVSAYLEMTHTLSEVIDRLGLSFKQIEVGGYSSQKVAYHGWWTIDGLKPLGHVVPPEITRDGFLDRILNIAVLLEALKPAPLRNTILKLGVEKKDIADFKNIKLLATLCQLATAAKNAGYRWPIDSAEIVAAWDKELILPSLRRLFALNQLRQKAAHRTGPEFSAAFGKDLGAFGLTASAHAAGWGTAVDSVYDGLISDFREITELLAPDD